MIRFLPFFLLLGIISTSVSAENPTVNLATSDWPPYVASDMKGYGYVYGIVNGAFQSAGYHTHIAFLPWLEVTQVDKNHFDAYFPEYDGHTLKSFACSDPIQGGPVGLYRRKNQSINYTTPYPSKNQAEAFASLKGYRFGVVSGYKNTDAFDNATYLIKIPANTDLENLRHLQEGKVDLAFIDIFVAEYLMNKYNPEFSDLVFMGPSLENKKLFVCFSRNANNYIEKLAAFNRGLKELSDSGRLEQIIEQYQF